MQRKYNSFFNDDYKKSFTDMKKLFGKENVYLIEKFHGNSNIQEKSNLESYDEEIKDLKFFHSGNVGDKPFNFEKV